MFASRVKAVFLQRRRSCFRLLLIGMTAAVLWLMAAGPILAQTTDTFSSPGSYPWTVPNGVTSIQVECRGAEGGATNDGAGGKGAKVVTTLSIPPGATTLYVRVGGRGHNGTRGIPAGDSQGGFNGGGNGGSGIESAGGGGGASDIRTNDSDPSTRLVSAAGGGGAGTGGVGSGGGDGGDPNGYAALNVRDSIGGFGATQTSGGAGGQGLNGANGDHGGGGGGGGWFGGGGGGGGPTGTSGAGGGGGSSNSTGTGTTYTRAAQTGDGYVSITTITVDSDGDGVPDDEDECPDSDLSATVVIDGCNSGVPNTLFPSGCTISDLIAACAEGASNHGQFVSCVSHVTNDLKKAGTITGQQKGAIQSCAAQADIP